MVLLGWCVGIVAACRAGPWDPLDLESRIAPFVRLPYLQTVDPEGAWVLWRADAAARDSFLYRVADGPEWRRAAVERRAVPRDDGDGARVPSAVADRLVRLSGLPPGTEVEYRVRADGVGFGPARFRTAPPSGGGGEVRVLAFGDSGWGSEAQLRLARLMEVFGPDLAVHTGDIAYPSGSARDFTLRHFHVYRKLLASVPFFPSAGNHDLETESGRPYERAFLWPAPRTGARYYGFRWGDVRFFALDTSGEPAGRELRRGEGAQYEWLVAALDSARGEPGLRWTVVYMHHPVYGHPTGFAGKGPDPDLRKALVPLFERYGVDLVLMGHDHHYERSLPLRDGKAVPPGCGPVYIVTGGGGASLFARGIRPAPLTARAARAHHFLELRIGDHLTVGRAVDVEGRALDAFRVRPYEGEGRAGPDCEPDARERPGNASSAATARSLSSGAL